MPYYKTYSKTVGAQKKGSIKNLDTGMIMKFQYNPEQFEYSRGVTYVEIASPGMSYPETQYVRGNARTFPVELFLFDKPYSGVIPKQIKFLEALLPPETNSDNYTKPPKILFVLSSFAKRCVVEDLNIKIEEYSRTGAPLMARVTLSLRQVEA